MTRPARVLAQKCIGYQIRNGNLTGIHECTVQLGSGEIVIRWRVGDSTLWKTIKPEIDRPMPERPHV